ncbi:MAG: ABC transporter ATP-binding protein, partial [Acidimicrobiia bacterium]|nr:ABC transporter ATP-binding protein [Acidimicrobiia bacterium]
MSQAAASPQDFAVLQLSGMTKRYGSVVACNNVDLALRRGEIHGILGENGAGKSTLMRMAIGLALPDRGTIAIDGEPCKIHDPHQAVEHGIGMVHQHYSLVDALSVWENVALGEQGGLDRETTRQRVREVCTKYGLEVDPDAVVRDLSAGMRQRVEIIKCLKHEPRIIILDEPTSVLTPVESQYLFEVLAEGVKREGWAVALVSHKLDEVLAATDRITIMRDGKVVERVMTADADAASLARAMVGRPVSLRTAAASVGIVDAEVIAATHAAAVAAEVPPILELDDLAYRAPDGAVVLDGLSIDVRPGEVVGVAGVEGNGQTTLARSLSSLIKLDSGTIRVGGKVVPSGVAGAMHRAGIAVIPADRHHSGCVPEMSVAENLVLSSLERVSDRGILSFEEMRRRSTELIREFDIHTPGPDVPLATLSGGNQQRVVLARALSVQPKVLVAHQPTRGLDVGAIEYIGERLRAAADDDGIGVLLVSTDLGEILALADRIVAIYRGRIIGEMSRDDLDLERLGLLIGG